LAVARQALFLDARGLLLWRVESSEAQRVMHKFILAGFFLCASVSALEARGGQQTWILVCPKSTPQSECNMTTASRWYHLPSPQASASTPAINAAKAQVRGQIDAGSYIHIEQFPAGVSLGDHARVFRACEDPPATPADSQEAEWAARGGCLR
jgi:hypothetical protein